MDYEKENEEEEVRTRMLRQRKGLHFGHALFIGILLLGVACIHFVFLSNEMKNSDHSASLFIFEGIFLSLLILTLLHLWIIMKTNPGYVFSNGATGTAHRCPTCNVVVEEFDHHCGLIGVCIGKGNMKYFVTFLCVGFFASFTGLVAGFVYVYRLGIWISSFAQMKCEEGLLEGMEQDRCNEGHYTLLMMYGSLIWDQVVWNFRRLVAVLTVIGFAYITFFCLGMFVIYVYKIASGTYSLQRRRNKMKYAWRNVFRNFFHPDFLWRMTKVSSVYCE